MTRKIDFDFRADFLRNILPLDLVFPPTMTKQPRRKTTRHGTRAIGQTAVSLTLDPDLIAWAKIKAEQDGRAFSNWLTRAIQKMHDYTGE